MPDIHHNPNTGTRHAGTLAACLYDTCIQARAEQQEHDTRTRAATYHEAADLIEADTTCATPAHTDHYAALLRDKADEIAPPTT